MDAIRKPILSDLRKVEKALRETLASGDGFVSQKVKPLQEAGGKRLRPTLVLTSAKACGYSGEKAIRASVAVELTHAASLIHDDVLDNAALRRGVPTLNANLGNRLSVLVGDYLYSRAISLLAEDFEAEIMQCFCLATQEMTEGEVAQTLSRKSARVDEEAYFSMISQKTASLMGCSCRIGALLGSNANGEVDALTAYGQNLGMVFQIVDDLLDLEGDASQTGKPGGADIVEGRLTLPFIHTLGAADKKDARWIEHIFQNGGISPADLKRMREIVRAHGGIDYSLKKAGSYSKACQETLKALPDSECRASLSLLADWAIQRKN